MKHRTQLYLDDDQYRWLRRRAGRRGSIAQVVRELIDGARGHKHDAEGDPLVRYLLEEEPADSGQPSSVATLDEDLYVG